ncbi:tyrosine-type recombinase/integrase [Streptomyces sp. NPDC014861]|uniref:tyrosine-type recombinase/integrase n=1 Tax=Streptomyces sp. NPDC014861 TaxID=3364923 RepID=UPI0037002C79
MDTTYNVKFWKTGVNVGKRKTTHTVRWELNGREHRQTFVTAALAESFRAGLVSAARKGEAFSLSTGLPVSHISQAAGVTWYALAIQFVDQLWARTSANNRRNVAKALTPVTIALLRSQPTAFKGVDVRRALREHAIKKTVLKENPLPKGKGAGAAASKTSSAVDKRSLLNKEQAAKLLGWVYARPRGGPRLHTFFATMYYAAARPEEVVALDVGDVRLPDTDADDQWGELLLHTAHPEVGRQWTNTGEVREQRGLKGRAADDTRTVPCRPALTRIFRAHIEREGLKPGELLMQGEKGGDLAGSVIRRAWRRARKEVLTPYEFGSPLGRRVYDLRHTCLTNWLNAGVPAATVAEWAGNSVPVLLATYARCIDGQLDDLKQRIEGAGELPDPAAAGV